jgi:hypothetical protein
MADTTIALALKTYQGACHCGEIKFSLTVPEIKIVTECNCSICFRKAYTWVFPPAGGLVFEEGNGAERLRAYEFAGRRMEHRVCCEFHSGLGIENRKTNKVSVSFTNRCSFVQLAELE